MDSSASCRKEDKFIPDDISEHTILNNRRNDEYEGSHRRARRNWAGWSTCAVMATAMLSCLPEVVSSTQPNCHSSDSIWSFVRNVTAVHKNMKAHPDFFMYRHVFNWSRYIVSTFSCLNDILLLVTLSSFPFALE
jgi:hypothetical protein